MNTDIVSAPVVAGAWRRLAAFTIDGLLLGLLAAGAGYLFFDVFVRLGPWGRLLGFCVALVYFGTLNSRLCNGQTVGKRLLMIKVVGADGRGLPIHKAALRFAVLGTPWFLNGASLSAGVAVTPLLYLVSMAVFGIGLSIIYLFLFNRPTRQSLHDLAAGSAVVQWASAGAVAASPIRRVHLIVVAILLVVSLGLPLVAKQLLKTQSFVPLVRAYEAVNAEPGVVHATVQTGWTRNANGEITYMHVIAYLDELRIEDVATATRLARRAIAANPQAMELDVVQITLAYGYDLGIASAQHSQAHVKAPAEWGGP